MPTLPRIGGLRVVIYPNDHPPPHVHVIGAQEQAVFEIGGDGAMLRESYRFTTGEVRRIADALAPRLVWLREEWERLRAN